MATDLRTLGYYPLALDEARKAEAGTVGLSETDELEVEATFRTAEGDSKGALAVLDRLHQLHPKALEYPFGSAQLELQNGSVPGCLRLLAVARASNSREAQEDPRLSMQEALCIANSGNYQNALQPVRRAETLAQRRNLQQIYAHARLLEAGLLMSAGHAPESRPLREEARKICDALGDKTCVLSALRVQANMDLSTLGPATALPEYLAALELDKETGAKGDLLNILNGIGIARGMLDDFAAADAAFVESLAVAQQLGAYNAVTRISQANTAILEGRLARAAALAEQAASDARKRGDKDIEIAAQIVRFQTMLLARNFAGAQSCLDQVRAIARGAKLPTATVALWNLSAASLSRLTGNLDRAASQLHQAKSVDEPFLSAELGEEQIELFLAQRNYKEAQHAAISLLASLANTGRKSAMARVAALLSDSYGYDGELTGARETAKTASSLLSSHSAPLARIMVLTSLVRWQENRSLAAHCLAEALALAKECGFRFAEHDARQPPAMLGMISNSHTNK